MVHLRSIHVRQEGPLVQLVGIRHDFRSLDDLLCEAEWLRLGSARSRLGMLCSEH